MIVIAECDGDGIVDVNESIVDTPRTRTTDAAGLDVSGITAVSILVVGQYLGP